MFIINLLPDEFRPKKEETHLVSMRFMSFVGCLSSVLICLALIFMVGTTKVNLNNLKLEWNNLQSKSVQADRIISEINQNYVQKNNVVQQIKSFNGNWALLLNELSLQIPDTVWFEKIRLQIKGPQNWELMIRGVSKQIKNKPSIKTIGEYVRKVKGVLELSSTYGRELTDEQRGQVRKNFDGLSVETVTNQKELEGFDVTEFKTWYLMEEEGVDNEK